ncbi:MAG: class I SAM-dependent methyltransferase [Gemmatimonadales bacterium]|nr:class I SAM-dependent methyltransferase [Gemmatimonadales bacterium]
MLTALPDRAAELAAAFRAAHYRDERPLIFADPFALRLASPGWRAICRYGPVRHFVFERLYGKYRPLRGHLLYQARIAEDWLEQFVDAGGRQYVLVGAGLDSFALRRTDLASQLRVFEVDRQAAQRAKRDRVSSLGLEPENVEWIPLDDARESLHDALRRSTFRFHRPAFVSWLGFSRCLDEQPLVDVLYGLAEVAVPGTRVAVGYLVAEQLDGAGGNRVLDAMTREGYGAHRAQPTEAAFVEAVEATGFRVLETVGPAEQDSYFAARTDGLTGIAASRMALLELEPPR